MMPDIATISSILTSLKAATEIAKFLKDTDISLEKAETKLKLAELVSALAETKSEIAEIQELLIEKDKKINELQYALTQHERMVWRDSVYYMQTEDGEEGPYCPQCYDSERKVIRLQTYEKGCWHCQTCDKTFFSNTYYPSGPNKADTDYDPFA
jgi:ribosomal protein L37AE/L43A